MTSEGGCRPGVEGPETAEPDHALSQNNTSAKESSTAPRFSVIRKGASPVFVVVAPIGRLRAGSVVFVSRKFKAGMAVIRLGEVIEVGGGLEIGTIVEQLGEVGTLP